MSNRPIPLSDLIDVSEAARILGIGARSVYVYASRGLIRGQRFGAGLMLSRKSVESYAATERKRGRPSY